MEVAFEVARQSGEYGVVCDAFALELVKPDAEHLVGLGQKLARARVLLGHQLLHLGDDLRVHGLLVLVGLLGRLLLHVRACFAHVGEQLFERAILFRILVEKITFARFDYYLYIEYRVDINISFEGILGGSLFAY